MQIEGLLVALFREDEFVYIHLLWPVLLQVAQKNQEECETRETLLTIDDIARVLLFANYDRAEKVVRISGNGVASMVRLIRLEELIAEVVYELWPAPQCPAIHK
jgi:hypothetical protein